MDTFKSHYPELTNGEDPLLHDDDLLRIHSALEAVGPSLEHETREHIIEQEFGGRAINAMLWRRNPDKTIVLPRYFGGGIGQDATWLAEAIQAIDDESSLLFIPNSTPTQDNLRFDDLERTRLANGDASPYTNRMEEILKGHGLADSELHFVGASQGSLISLAVAEQLKERTGSLTLLEMPELGSSSSRNALNLMKSMRHYDTNQAIGGLGLEVPLDEGLRQDKKKGRTEITPDMLALNNFMKVYEADLALDALTRHQSRPVTIAWGNESLLSSDERNEQRIVLAGPKAEGIKFNSKYSDHSIAMMPLPIAALARQSMNMRSIIGPNSLVA